MADFVEKSVVKTATRELAAPIADIATFDSIVQDVLTNNPWGCTPYVSGSVSHDGVEKGTEGYTAKFLFEDLQADEVGNLSAKAEGVAAYNGSITAILADTALATAMGGDCLRRDGGNDDSFSCTLKCHDANGELYNVKFTREYVTISSYESDSIMTTIETWADTVPELA